MEKFYILEVILFLSFIFYATAVKAKRIPQKSGKDAYLHHNKNQRYFNNINYIL
jgi:hypothetical protein